MLKVTKNIFDNMSFDTSINDAAHVCCYGAAHSIVSFDERRSHTSIMNAPATASQQSAIDTQKIDLQTVAAMAIIAYLLSAIIHEALGHGLAALLLGAKIRHVTSLDLVSNTAGLGAWSIRAIAAAGCVAQFIVAGVLYLVYRATAATAAPDRRYFLWLFMTINLFIPAGYLMALSFAPFGDWNDFVQGLPLQVVWRLAFTLSGVAISLAALFGAVRGLAPFIGRDKQMRYRRGFALTLTPYLVGSLANTLAGVFNPDSPLLILSSAAAASFGGTIFLFWTGYVAWASPPTADTPTKPLTIARSPIWIGMGVVALIIYFFVLGPGIPR